MLRCSPRNMVHNSRIIYHIIFKIDLETEDEIVQLFNVIRSELMPQPVSSQLASILHSRSKTSSTVKSADGAAGSLIWSCNILLAGRHAQYRSISFLPHLVPQALVMYLMCSLILKLSPNANTFSTNNFNQYAFTTYVSTILLSIEPSPKTHSFHTFPSLATIEIHWQL